MMLATWILTILFACLGHLRQKEVDFGAKRVGSEQGRRHRQDPSQKPLIYIYAQNILLLACRCSQRDSLPRRQGKPVVAGNTSHKCKHQSAPMGLFVELAARNYLINKKHISVIASTLIGHLLYCSLSSYSFKIRHLQAQFHSETLREGLNVELTRTAGKTWKVEPDETGGQTVHTTGCTHSLKRNSKMNKLTTCLSAPETLWWTAFFN